MKLIRLALLILTVVAPATVYGVTPVSSPAQSEDSIQIIRGQYTRINSNATRYRRVKKELSGFSAEGGELVAYFDKSGIVKISATYYGEMGRSTEDYYYANEKLIFVLHRDFHYKRPLSGKVIRIDIDRFYFNNDQMIRWVDPKGTKVLSTSQEYADKQDEYLKSSKQFIDGARSTATTIEANP